MPNDLRRRTTADDRLILLAYWQEFQAQAPKRFDAGPLADPVFFDLVGLIYAASHDQQADAWRAAQLPHQSLYLLRQYLRLHPALKTALTKALTRGGGSMRWNTSNILHKMQVVVDTFLRYHGLAAGRTLNVSPEVPSWDVDGPRCFQVRVKIHPEALLGAADGVVPGRDEVAEAGRALAWVLWALFAYSEELGLKRPVYW